MLELQTISEKRNEIIEALKKRNVNAEEMITEVISLDEQRKSLQGQNDEVLAQVNSRSKEIGNLFKNGQIPEANKLKDEVKSLKDKSSELGKELETVKDQIHKLLLNIPNVPHQSVPSGNSAEDNIVEFEVEKIEELPDDSSPHWELAEKYEIIDFETGVKLTGAGFPVYKGMGAKLQRALINFFLQEAEAAGYLEMQPPLLVNEDSGYGTGQLPDKEGQMYHVQNEDFYLIPTAEVPLTNVMRNEIIEEVDLPIKYTGYTPCFRREAGSYGKDVRGLNRLHQFDKVEIVQFVLPQHSYDALEEMKNHIAGLLGKLKLPYRILRLCGGDLGFTSALTFDFETYSAAQKRWLEVSSVSNFETYQSNRMKIRYRPASHDGKKTKTELVHTLNGSALALPRILATILENYQTKDGILVPEVLQPFTGFKMISK